jgi:hypothetical protein
VCLPENGILSRCPSEASHRFIPQFACGVGISYDRHAYAAAKIARGAAKFPLYLHYSRACARPGASAFTVRFAGIHATWRISEVSCDLGSTHCYRVLFAISLAERSRYAHTVELEDPSEEKLLSVP